MHGPTCIFWANLTPFSLQRTRKSALDRGEPSKGMTAARAAKLDALGFTWQQRDHNFNLPV
jgi:hypothetical protein